MSAPFVGEIRCFGFTFAPYNWAHCNGQAVAISQNETLYAIIGTIYGGDGINTFNVPNLQGQAPMHWGNGVGGLNTQIGQVQGTTSVTLVTAQTPQHNHTITVQEFPSGQPASYRTAMPNPNAWISNSRPGGVWDDAASPPLNAQFAPQVLTTVGGSQPHENMQPYLVLNFCMCMYGIFPSRN
jgi:microcystin-dependent protein